MDLVHWHILREDQHRAGVAARTSSVLSTNALLIAGTALTFSVRGPARPHPASVLSALGILIFVASSVVFASMALVSPRTLIRLRNWAPSWQGFHTDASMVYSYAYYGHRWASFDEFYTAVTQLSPEQQLRGALLELWITAAVDQYRYRKLRAAIRCLIVAIGLLLVTVALTVIIR